LRVTSAIFFSFLALIQFFALLELNVYEMSQIIYKSIMVMITLIIGFLITFSFPQPKRIIISHEIVKEKIKEDEESKEEALKE
jgi:hypothetical protein